MAKYSVEDTSLTAIADAIRGKTGKEDALTLDGMAAAVAGLNVAGKNVEFIGLIDRTITEAVSEDVTEIGNYAFYSCENLTSVDFPSVEKIEYNAFGNCAGLKSVNFPSATSIGNYAFANCQNIESADFPKASNISIYMFQGCPRLENVNFPHATIIDQYAFWNCTGLKIVNFPKATNIRIQAFRNAEKLTAVILSSDTVCTLSSTNVFTSTPIASGTGYIYVPAALVDSYKAATNWSTYADQIRAIEDYPDITGGAA